MIKQDDWNYKFRVIIDAKCFHETLLSSRIEGSSLYTAILLFNSHHLLAKISLCNAISEKNSSKLCSSATLHKWMLYFSICCHSLLSFSNTSLTLFKNPWQVSPFQHWYWFYHRSVLLSLYFPVKVFNIAFRCWLCYTFHTSLMHSKWADPLPNLLAFEALVKFLSGHCSWWYPFLI